MSLIHVRDLSVRFATGDGQVHAVNGINFSLDAGQTLGIVGESGSGKSQSVLAMMGLLAKNGSSTGQVLYENADLLTMSADKLNQIRGNRVAMIFQDPMTSLNPYLTVERQMTEVLQFHKGMDRQTARAKSVRMLDAVKIPDATQRINTYPHEFSGGMRQRVMIAMALLCEPQLLIADEPTTALDVTVQAQILTLLRELQRDFGTAIVLITHDLGVVAGLCDKVMVLYGGRVMEQGDAEDIFYHPSHPYTVGLLGAIARLDQSNISLRAIPGAPPNMSRPLPGCPFQPRCALALPQCRVDHPALLSVAGKPHLLRACYQPTAQVTALHNSNATAQTQHG
jgi:oligopeptide transport system ATP-binding protein